MKQHKVALLAGDGIGPEIMKEAIKVIETIEKRLKKEFKEEEVIDFMKGKYFFVLEAVKDININDFSDDKIEAVENFLININKKLSELVSI